MSNGPTLPLVWELASPERFNLASAQILYNPLTGFYEVIFEWRSGRLQYGRRDYTNYRLARDSIRKELGAART